MLKVVNICFKNASNCILNDLFDVMKEKLAPKYNLKPSNIKTKIIGIRPGEKLLNTF